MGSAFADSLRGIKHFGIFVSEGEIGISSTLAGTNSIKYKIFKWTPLGSAFADSLRGIKVFEDFRKADYQGKIETSIFASQSHIKMERPSSGPLGVCFRRLPSGDKGFRDFQKGGLPSQN